MLAPILYDKVCSKCDYCASVKVDVKVCPKCLIPIKMIPPVTYRGILNARRKQ